MFVSGIILEYGRFWYEWVLKKVNLSFIVGLKKQKMPTTIRGQIPYCHGQPSELINGVIIGYKAVCIA